MNLRNLSRRWFGAVLLLTVLQGVVSVAVARGYWLTFFSDWICAALILSVVAAFSWNAKFAAGRVRLFWILQASSWALLLVNQGIWMFFDLILKKDIPGLFAGDALLFVSGVPALAGLLLQPHIAPSKEKNRLGTVDFLLLLVWWVYLYLFFVVPWQYVIPNEGAYNSSYDVLAVIQDTVMLLVLGILAYRASAGWRHFYTAFFLVELLRCSSAFVLNRAIELNQYYAGSWYDLPYLLCVALFTGVAVIGKGLQATRERPEDELTTFVGGDACHDCAALVARVGGTRNSRPEHARPYHAVPATGHDGHYPCDGLSGFCEAASAGDTTGESESCTRGSVADRSAYGGP